jgi:hypothetical protein
VTDTDWERFKIYDRFRKVSEEFLRYTSKAEAPWIVVEGADPHYRSLTVGKLLLEAMRERLDEKPVVRLPDRTPPMLPRLNHRDLLGALDLSKRVPKAKYERELERWQGKLNLLSSPPL